MSIISRLFYCNLQQTSTNLHRTFFDLKKIVDKLPIGTFPSLRYELKKKRKLSEKDLRNQTKTWKKFIFVREPMERLASCFNDKIYSPVDQHYQPSFIKKFRTEVKNMATNIKQKLFSHKNISFDDFLVAKVINGKETATEYGRQSISKRSSRIFPLL